LSGLRYSVFGCGSSVYSDLFNKVGSKVDSALETLGGARIAEMHVGDEEKSNTTKKFKIWEHKVTHSIARASDSDLTLRSWLD